MLEPPLLTKGKVTPVKGNKSVMPKILSIVWNNIIAMAPTPAMA